jgi:hypothetical protein
MRLAILAALLSITLGARVQAQQAMIIISGTGLYSCGRWTDDRRNFLRTPTQPTLPLIRIRIKSTRLS